MDTKVKIAVVGVGVNTQRNHLPQLQKLSSENLCSIVAICDLNKQKALTTAGAYGCDSVFDSVDEMLQQTSPEAVFIAGTPDMQYKNAKKVLTKGIHVFVEKPPAQTLDQTLELIALAKEKRCIFFCGFNRRFEPGIMYIKNQFPAGSRLVSLQGIFHNPSLNKPAPYEIGSWLDSNGIHALDTILFLAGKRPNHIASSSTKGSSRVDGAYSTLLSWEEGFHAVFSSNNSVGAKKEEYIAHGLGVSFNFEKGNVTVYRDGKADTPIIEKESGFYFEHKHFLGLVRNKKGLVAHAEFQAAETMYILSLVNSGYSGDIDWSVLENYESIAVSPEAAHSISILILNPSSLQNHLPRLAESYNLVFKEGLHGLTVEERSKIHAVITGREGNQSVPVTNEIITLLPNLKVVGVVGASVKKYVTEDLIDRKIPIINVADVYGVAVAEFNLMQAMIGIKNASRSHDVIRLGGWNSNENRLLQKIKKLASRHRALYRSIPLPIIKLAKKATVKQQDTHFRVATGGNNLQERVVGLVGYGAIAREFIKLLTPFNCKIKVHSDFLSKEEAEKLGVELVSLDDALNSDIVSIHRGLSDRTYKSIGKRELDQLKPGAVLVNASRGQIFDEDALIERLKKGDIFACLDVFSVEPLPVKSPLRKMPNVFLTSHIAGATQEMYEDAPEFLIGKVLAFLKGEDIEYVIQDKDFFKNMT